MDCNRFSQCKMLSFTEIISFKTVISIDIQHIWFHMKKVQIPASPGTFINFMFTELFYLKVSSDLS